MSIHNTTFNTEDVFNVDNVLTRDFIPAFSSELGEVFDSSMSYRFIVDSAFKDVVLEEYMDNHPELKNLPAIVAVAIDWNSVIRDITIDYSYFMFGDTKIHYIEE